MKTAWLSTLLIVAASIWVPAAVSSTNHKNDPHYLPVGFFDLHVCNWPDRKPFFLAVFSSYQHDKVKRVNVFAPNGNKVGGINLANYRLIRKEGKPLKKAFLTEMELTEPLQNGWYRAEIEMINGARYIAKDFVEIRLLPRALNRIPAAGATNIAAPRELKWDPVPEAKFYRVVIKDLWNDEKMVYSSKLLKEPRLVVPSGLLQPGGYYSWLVHARDVNEDPVLGDFNRGSQTDAIEFSIKP
ncbi:MAG: hypothetical protein LJE56_01855 [Acidiferrobacterales bacterium]|jgi:hypothetical protein|nr:hypothetical protein [Acidiferrobacterales bacterium]